MLHLIITSVEMVYKYFLKKMHMLDVAKRCCGVG